MTKQSNATLQLVTESMIRIIVAILLIFWSVQRFSNSSYTLSTTQVYAATNCATATVPQAQCEALVAIFTGMWGSGRNAVYTQGTGNTNLWWPSSGWLMNDDPCRWHGVTCDSSSPRNVIGIHFAWYNVPTDTIRCGESSDHKAWLNWSFPISFSSLDKLKTFNIGYNTWISQPSLQSLTMPSSLQYYCAYNAWLTSLSPNQFAWLSGLSFLNLENNQLQSLNPTQFQGLNSLQYLYFTNNQIAALSPTQFQGLTNLHQLYFSQNQITWLNATQFQGLTNLNTLVFFNNQITSLNPTQFQGLNSLQTLSFNNNQIAALSPTQFQGLTGLWNLFFDTLKKDSPYFTWAIPAFYSGLNFTTNPTQSRYLYVRTTWWSNSNTICWQEPTWITNAWNQYFSGNRNNTDLDDLIRFWWATPVNLCPLGASCNPTASPSDCASGLTCLENVNQSGIFTCQGTGTNQSPTVTLTIPNNIAPHTAPATISLEATATDTDGTIYQVQFMSGATVLATDMSSPYAYTRTGVWAWTYSITAIATDNSGATTTSNAVSVTVLTAWTTAYTLKGTLWITGANASVNVCGSTVTANGSGVFSRSMIASGTNCSDISASKSWHTCTISTQWPNPLTGNISNVVWSCTPTTWNQAPTVSLTSPTNWSTFTAPASITLSANASDPDGTIVNVQFRNGTTILNTDTTSPYSYSRTSVPAWTYTLTAIATDNNGAMTTSTPVTITVQSSNEWWNNGGNNTTCTAWSYRNGTTCTTCPANNYCPAWATTPTACPSWTTSPSGSRSMSHCINPNNPDSDGDGIPDNQEQTAPNTGDANFDGIQDATQTTVRTYQTPSNGVQATIALTWLSTCTGTIITQLQTENQVANDTSYTYPYGLNRIIVACGQATVRVYYHGASTLPSMTYRKYLNNSYQNFPVTFGTQSGTPYLQFTLVDWWAGDSDGAVNGTINDPGWIAVIQSAPPSGGWGGGGWRSSSVNCGNGRLDTGEQCDDGNGRGGDWCSGRCTNESWTITWWNIDPTTPKATMIKMLQETLDTLKIACENEDDDRTKKIKNMRDMNREDRFDPEATLTNYCITKGYKNKRQKNAAMGIGEAIKVVTKIATINEWISFREGEKPDRTLPYKDIKSNAWYATYVNVAYDKWILDGLTDSHRNEKELKAFTPISASQLLLMLENAGWNENSFSLSDEDQALDDVLWLILPAKQDLSPLKWKTISRSQAAQYIVNAFPHYFANYEYLVGNNAIYLWNILAWISQKNEAEQRSYIIDKINILKDTNEATYGEKYKIDTEVIITFLEKVIN
jgi:cysteine-rich repeat protein